MTIQSAFFFFKRSLQHFTHRMMDGGRPGHFLCPSPRDNLADEWASDWQVWCISARRVTRFNLLTWQLKRSRLSWEQLFSINGTVRRQSFKTTFLYSNNNLLVFLSMKICHFPPHHCHVNCVAMYLWCQKTHVSICSYQEIQQVWTCCKLHCYLLFSHSFITIFAAFWVFSFVSLEWSAFQIYLLNYSTRGQCSLMKSHLKKKNLFKTLKLMLK